MRCLIFVVLLVPFIWPSSARSQWADSFVGGWEWVSTEYAGGTIETPDSVGYTQQYLFGEQGDFVVYRDHQVYAESRWAWNEVIVGPCTIESLATEHDESVWYFMLLPGIPSTLVLTDGIWAPPCGVEIPITKTLTFTYVGTVPSDRFEWGALKAQYR